MRSARLFPRAARQAGRFFVPVVLGLLVFLPATSALPGPAVRVIEDFESGLGSSWEEKSFSGLTAYRVVPDGEGHCLQAESSGAASGLVREIEYDPRDFPLLRWRWRIQATLPEGDGRTKAGDDYAARVYVIFPHWFFPKTRTLNYIWANRIPRGEFLPNAFTGNAVMVAVESGDERAGAWVAEERNVLEDFRRAFGEDPPKVGAIAVMTDTDNTGGHAVACYDDLVIARPAPTTP